MKAKAYLLPYDISLGDRIMLEKNVVIRKLSEKEKEQKKNKLQSIRSVDFEYLKYCIEITLDIKPLYDELAIGIVVDPFFKKSEEIFDKVLLALRLFKEGSIGYNEFDLYDLVEENRYAGTVSRVGYFWGEPYKLNNDEIPKFIEFYNKIKSLSPVNFAKVSMERFRTIYERDKIEDRLIDLFIALESLFIKENIELSYRLALNIASYLANNSEERKKIFDRVRRAYNFRSKIVHGNSDSIRKEELNEIISSIESYFRKSIQKILIDKQGKDKNHFLDYVEKKVLCI